MTEPRTAAGRDLLSLIQGSTVLAESGIVALDAILAIETEASAWQQPLDVLTYEQFRKEIEDALDRDGQHEWDETARLAEVIAPKLWNGIGLAYVLGNGAADRAISIDVVLDALVPEVQAWLDDEAEAAPDAALLRAVDEALDALVPRDGSAPNPLDVSHATALLVDARAALSATPPAEGERDE